MVFNSKKCITSIKKPGVGKDKDKRLSIVLLNALCGHRMKSYGPRCLLKINNEETLIESQIKILKECYPNSEIIVTVGFDSDKIIKKKLSEVRYVENQLYDTTNMAEEIRLAVNNCETNNVLFIQGEMVFNHNSIDNLTRNGSCVVCVDSVNDDKDEIGATIIDGNATIFSYGLNPKWGGIVYLSDPEIAYFKSIVNNKEYNNLYLFELINIVANKFDNIRTVQYNDKLLRIDSIKDIK